MTTVCLDPIHNRLSIYKTLPGQAAEDILDVGVVSSGLGDGDAQLGVAESSDGSDDARDDPDNEGQAHRAGILQHPLGAHKDTRADDVTWGDGVKNIY